MGANAQKRRVKKTALRIVRGTQVRQPSDTKTMQRLRAKLAEVTSQLQIEEMIRAAHPDNRPRVRQLLYDLAPKDLPCCNRARLGRLKGENPLQHGDLCPVGGRVVIVTP